MRRASLFLLVCSLAAAQTPEVTEGQITKFSSGYQFVSALAWSKDGFLLVADGPAAKIRKIDSKGTTVWREGLSATGLDFGDKGDLFISEGPQHRVLMLDRKGKGPEVLASAWEGKRLNGPRGVAAARNGHVYFTDPAFGSADRKRELPFYGVYRISPKGELDVIARLSSRPGGLALSEDGRSLYVAAADDRMVLAWSLDKNGTASESRVFARVEGVPDGIAIGPDKNIWVAARDVEVFSPDGGKITSWKLADKPFHLEFGEDDLHSLFVGAGQSVYKLRLPNRTAGRSQN